MQRVIRPKLEKTIRYSTGFIRFRRLPAGLSKPGGGEESNGFFEVLHPERMMQRVF